MRKLKESQLVIATHNFGKYEEISDLFSKFKIKVFSSSDYNLIEPKETENTFIGNARIKAHYTSKETGLPSLADDSGIEVKDLNNQPGVYTADWAETKNGRDFDIAMKKVWLSLKEVNAKKPFYARFCCTLVLAWPDGHDEIFEGIMNGQIVWPRRGKNGHGFDPIFLPKGFKKTFGEIDRWEKNRISHRAIAFNKLITSCLS